MKKVIVEGREVSLWRAIYAYTGLGFFLIGIFVFFFIYIVFWIMFIASKWCNADNDYCGNYNPIKDYLDLVKSSLDYQRRKRYNKYKKKYAESCRAKPQEKE